MSECIYNYSLEDNLNATKQLLIQKSRRKTSIVSLFVVVLSIFGIIGSIGMLIGKSGNWYVGLISAVLLLCYFGVDKVLIQMQLKKQKEFFNSSQLKNVTKVKIYLDENKTVTENFYVKEKLIGTNTYQYKDLSALKFLDENIYLIYNNKNVVLIKKNCLTEKSWQEFIDLKEKFTISKKKVKK